MGEWSSLDHGRPEAAHEYDRLWKMLKCYDRTCGASAGACGWELPLARRWDDAAWSSISTGVLHLESMLLL
jgi:hypothetical protein